MDPTASNAALGFLEVFRTPYQWRATYTRELD